MNHTTRLQTLMFAAVLALFSCIATAADGLTGMGMDAVKEQAVDKAVDTGSSMAKDQAKSAMGMKDTTDAAEDASAEAEETAEAAEAATEKTAE